MRISLKRRKKGQTQRSAPTKNQDVNPDSLDIHQRLVGGEAVARLGENERHDAGDRGLDRGLHFHHFHHRNLLAFLDLLTDFDLNLDDIIK
jgi:hypothetical protein